MNINKLRLKDKKLYLTVNSDTFGSDEAFLDAVAASLEAGVEILQLSEKNSSAQRIINLGKRIRELCSIYDVLFIVGERADIAKIVDADGVHLSQDDIGIESARDILDLNAIVGVSAHTPEQALKAQVGGADYVAFGPVIGEGAVGLQYLKWASENINVPLFAFGAIDKENVQDVLNTGATRVAIDMPGINNTGIECSMKSILEKLK